MMLVNTLKIILFLTHVTDIAFGTTLSPLDHSTYPTEYHSNEYSTEEISLTNSHQPRENVRSDSSMNFSSSTLSNSTTESFNKITSIFEVPKKNDGKSSVPKKGVENAISTKNSTISASSDIQHALSSESTTPSRTSKNESYTDVNNHKDGDNTEKESKSFATLVIAGMISMPLVALLFVGLYKVWSEWWQHRHYRRMDFLIEGMYNN